VKNVVSVVAGPIQGVIAFLSTPWFTNSFTDPISFPAPESKITLTSCVASVWLFALTALAAAAGSGMTLGASANTGTIGAGAKTAGEGANVGSKETGGWNSEVVAVAMAVTVPLAIFAAPRRKESLNEVLSTRGCCARACAVALGGALFAIEVLLNVGRCA